jgi:long-chain fatty acid transport protein
MRKIGAVFAVAALGFASPALATNGMRMIGFGPVQTSMGGVGVGATLDAMSIASNPAGLLDLGSRLDLGVGYFKPTVSHEAVGTPLPAPFPPSMIAQDGKTIDSDRGGSPIPAIGYVRPLSDRLSTGVGVFAVSGMGVDYPSNIFLSRALTSYLNARLAPGVAYRISDVFTVGVALNAAMAQMEYDVAGNAGQAKHSTATSFGVGGTVGLKAKVNEMLSLGAAYESKTFFQDFSFDVPGGTDKLTFDQPQVATIGAAVRPIDMLLVAVDVGWINWSDTMGKNLPKYSQNQGSGPGAPSQAFDMGWQDQWVLKVGAQVTPTKGLDLRAGYDYGAMPLVKDRAFENLVFPAVAEHHFTLGAGYALADNIAVQVTGMYSPEAKISGANQDQAIASYTTKMSQFQIDFGGTYRF